MSWKRRTRAGVLASFFVGMVALGLGWSQPSVADTGTWSNETIAGMNVRTYVPASAPALPGGRALMVSLHGCIQTNANLQSGGNWQAVADDLGMVVALPAAPNGGVIAGCWDYYDTNHSGKSPARHDDNLLALTDTLLARSSLDVDPAQVYLSGLSSGAGETMVMGCLAPDVFAGIGINAGPTVGTGSGQIGSVATTAAAATATCKKFAGDRKPGFANQLTSVVNGDADYTVAQGYNALNASVMAGIYGATSTAALDMTELAGANTQGQGTIYADSEGPRVSLISNSGVGHAWPAGGGPGGSFIATNSIDYPRYVSEFFFANNRRVDRTEPTPTEPTPTEPTPTEPTPTEPTPTEPTSTSTPSAPAGDCWNATNAEHQAAGRAISYGVHPYNPFYAIGSQDYLGQGNATRTSVELTQKGRYDIVQSCP